MTTCADCGGERWVCEAHPDRPWDDTAPNGKPACTCGAPGMPCPSCNLPGLHLPASSFPAFPPGSVHVWSL